MIYSFDRPPLHIVEQLHAMNRINKPGKGKIKEKANMRKDLRPGYSVWDM